MSEPLVSVVTPFYNTARYLRECIESVLRQTYRTFEYVLVNNCSDDGSREIAASYAARDGRIRLIDQPAFLGQTENYNSALGAISPDSRYCKMVQADDWIFPHCLEDMVAVAERDPRIGIVGSLHYFGSQIQFRNMPLGIEVYEGAEICRRQLAPYEYKMGNPTTLLFAARCVRARTPFLQPGRIADDLEACFDILRENRFGFVHQLLSYVRVRDDSILGVHLDDDFVEASDYAAVRRYGPVYLPPAERAAVEADVARHYWRKLGLGFLFGRRPAYWAYHRARLAEIGETLRRAKVVEGAAWTVARLLSHPGWTWQTLRQEAVRRKVRRAIRKAERRASGT